MCLRNANYIRIKIFYTMIESTSTTTTTIVFDKSPSTICSGYTNINGKWITGFVCPIQNSIQYFCCGTDNYRYCCPPDRYTYETRLTIDYPHTYNNILYDEISNSLIDNRKLLNKQFEQFQRYFLPVFLLTTTILFLIGIALWFWLYKHKTFYSLGQDDLIESQSLRRKSSDTMIRKHTLERQAHLLTHSSTEV